MLAFGFCLVSKAIARMGLVATQIISI